MKFLFKILFYIIINSISIGLLHGQKPVLNSFSPTYGIPGTLVTINGSQFTGVSSVKFGNTEASSFTINNDSIIQARVGNGSTGIIKLTNAAGSDTSKNNFIFGQRPNIRLFTPSTGTIGTKVTITGTNFTYTKSIIFNDTEASSFTIKSDTTLEAIVGSGSSGRIFVFTEFGSDTTAYTFIFSAAKPIIKSFTPASGITGTKVTISGNNFTNVTSVKFGNTDASSFTINNDSTIQATVGIGSTGIIQLINGAGSDTSKTNFTYNITTVKPVLNSFSPTYGIPGTLVTINGSQFTGVTSVKFGNTEASSFTINNDSTIQATVGTGSTGIIKVTNSGGSDTSKTNFTFTTAVSKPIFRSFTPSSGTTGTQVKLIGNSFTGVTSVKFGNTEASSFTINNDSTIQATVGTGSTGIIKVTNSGGSDTSKTNFTFTTAVSKPIFRSFTPSSGTTGTQVKLIGNSFTGVTSVKFGNTEASSFTINNDSTIQATVGTGSTGIIKVTNSGGSDTSKTNFTFTTAVPKPIFRSFTPSSGSTGTQVTLSGNSFTGVTSVKFGNTEASSFTINNDSTIQATVGTGSTGIIKVTNSGGSDTSKTNFTFVTSVSKPIFKSFTPSSGSTGTQVTLSGNSFTGVTSVKFGNTEASSFTINNDSTIQATVGTGSTGIIKVTNSGGSDTSKTNFTFTTAVSKPIFRSFTPSSGTIGTRVTISGNNFTNISSVKFGTKEALTFAIINDSTIQANVGGGSTGVIKVSNTAGSDTSKTIFTFIEQTPSRISFNPTFGTIGTKVIIEGYNFTGVTSVKFGNTEAASFSLTNSDSTITAIVGSGSTGRIRVTNTAGSDSSSNIFTFNPVIKPVFNSFSPNIGSSGTQVIIKGNNFTGVSSVTFGNTEATSFKVNNDSTIQATLGKGSTGIVKVSNSAGNDSSKSIFLYLDTIARPNYNYTATNRGKEFWVGYGSHVSMYGNDGSPNKTTGGSQDMVLYFTSDRDANVTVSIPAAGNGWSRTYKVLSGQITVSEPMPKIGESDARLSYEGKYNKGIRIVSDVEISAYTHIYNASISGACLLYPVVNFGTEYSVLNYTQVSNAAYSYSYAYAIATEDSTIIEITPSVNTINRLKGDTIKVVLNKGEVYNIMGKLTTTTNPFKGEDLSGTKFKVIKSNNGNVKKIAVFSGSGKLSLNCTNSSGSADNFIQQSYPATAWGQRFLTVPTKNMPNNYYRIAVSDSVAIVKVDGIILAKSNLKNGFYYEYSSNIPNIIESNKPIMTAQYITTANSCGNTAIAGNGDPEMIYLSSIEQNVNNITVYSTSNYNIGAAYHFANIVIPKKGATSLKIDGIALTGSIVHPGDTNYLYYQPQLTAGSHTIVSDSGFNAIAYGYGSAESYGYNAGISRMDLSVPEIYEEVINNIFPSLSIKYFTNDNSVIYIYKDTIPNSSKIYDSLDFSKLDNRVNSIKNPEFAIKTMGVSDLNSIQTTNRYVDLNNKLYNKVIYYRITSKNSKNVESDLSNQIKTIIFSNPNALYPNNDEVKIDTNILLKWTKIPNALLYQIQFSSDSNFQKDITDLILKDTISSKNNLKDNSYYYWRLKAMDSLHVSNWSNKFKFQTYIKPPSLNSLKTSNKKIQLSWINKSSGNIKFYKVYKSTNSSSFVKVDSITSNVTTFNDTLINGISYSYKITAGNFDNIESNFSNMENFVCLINKPDFNTSKYSICGTDSIKLTINNISKGDTLKWFYGTKSDLTNVSNKTFSDSTKLFVIRIDSIGCSISSDTVQIKKFAIPSTPTLIRDTANYLTSGATGTTWYKDGVALTDTTQKYKPTTPGSYTAKTTSNGCTSVMSTAYYYLVTDIINLSKDEFIQLAPNPFINQINFDFVIKGYQKLNIEVFDLATGTRVASQPNLTAGSRISLGQLAGGTYIIRVTSNDNKIVQQFKVVKL
jgi:hypothetical protein